MATKTLLLVGLLGLPNSIQVSVKMANPVEIVPLQNSTFTNRYWGANLTNQSITDSVRVILTIFYAGPKIYPSKTVIFDDVSNFTQNSLWPRKLVISLTCIGPYYGTGTKVTYTPTNATTMTIQTEEVQLGNTPLEDILPICNPSQFDN